MANVSETRTSETRTSAVSGASGATEARNAELGSSLDRSMTRVASRDVQAEAAGLVRGDLVADGVDRVESPTSPTAATGLAPGANGAEVEALQTRLTELGYDAGAVDGDYGRRTERAVRSFQLNNDLPLTGEADATTLARLNSPDARRYDPSKTEFPQYRPGSPEQIALFEDAARRAGLPESWASSPGLINLLDAESDGHVGRPNYTYGARHRDETQWHEIHEELRAGRITAESSATGLGQLLLSNVDRYYPSGRQGIGNPTEEAIGMLRYIEDRYGTPDAAWERYNSNHEGY